MKTLLTETANPINYVGGGLKAVPAVVGATTAGDIALKGDRSGMTLQDATRVADDASVGLVMGKAIDSLMGFNPKRALLGEEARTSAEVNRLKQLADEQGVKLTPATLTGSPNLARMEYSISDSPAGALGMTKTLNAERETAGDAAVRTLERIGGNASPTVAGDEIIRGIQSSMEQEKSFFHNKFKDMFARYGDDKVFSIKGVKDEAKRFVEQAEQVPLLKGSQAYTDAKKILDTDDKLSWNDWSKFRSTLGSMTQDATVSGKASTGVYKNLYSKLEDDLKGSVYALGDDATLKQYNDLIGEYKSFKETFDGKGSRYIQSLARGTGTPEGIGRSAINSVSRARQLFNAAGVDTNTGIPLSKKAAATDVLSSMRRGDDVSLRDFVKYTNREGFKEVAKQPNFNVSTQLDDISPTRQLFGREKITDDFANVQGMQDIARAINRKESFKNMSKTAQYNLLNMLKMMNPAQLVSYLAKDIGVSALYRSEMFKDWLESGIISPSYYKLLVQHNAPRNSAIRNTAINSLMGIDANR